MKAERATSAKNLVLCPPGTRPVSGQSSQQAPLQTPAKEMELPL